MTDNGGGCSSGFTRVQNVSPRPKTDGGNSGDADRRYRIFECGRIPVDGESLFGDQRAALWSHGEVLLYS